MSACNNDTAEKAALVSEFETFIRREPYFNGFSDMRFANGMIPNRTYVDMTMELAYRSYVKGFETARVKFDPPEYPVAEKTLTAPDGS